MATLTNAQRAKLYPNFMSDTPHQAAAFPSGVASAPEPVGEAVGWEVGGGGGEARNLLNPRP